MIPLPLIIHSWFFNLHIIIVRINDRRFTMYTDILTIIFKAVLDIIDVISKEESN